jgi:hypothetical protein
MTLWLKPAAGSDISGVSAVGDGDAVLAPAGHG